MNRSYRSYQDAKKFALEHKITTQHQWREFAKTDRRPNDVPASPPSQYEEWTSWGDFLGTGVVANQKRSYRSYEDAKKFALEHKITNSNRWRVFAKSKSRPSDIPANPERTYKNEWTGWGDFLGTGTVANQNRSFRSYEDAKSFVRAQEILSKDNWYEFAGSGKLPEDIPANLPSHYKNEWTGWGDFLGTGRIATFNREYRSYREARDYVRSQKINNYNEWRRFAKTDRRPSDIPASPPSHYKNEWTSWGDFLGTGFIAHTKRSFRSYEDAKKFALEHKITSLNQWREFAKTDRRPSDIPANPERTYKNEWTGWGDFLGTGVIAYQNKVYRKFEEAIDYVHNLKLTSHSDWCAYVKSGKKPDDIPGDPYSKYKSNFISWSHWLGSDKKIWTKSALINFVRALSPIIDNLDPSELLSIIQTNNVSLAGLPNDFLPRKALEMALQGNTDKAKEIINSFKSVPIDEEENTIIETTAEEDFNTQVLSENIDVNSSPALPNLDVNSLLQTMDYIEQYKFISDTDTVRFLIKKKVTQLWNIILNDKNPLNTFDKINTYPDSGFEYEKIVRNTFIEEYKSTNNLPTPKGYQFKVGGKITPPNKMQKLIAYKVLQNRRIGNWSGTGSGKTLGALVASRTIESALTVVIGLNNTILENDNDSGWCGEINNAFPDSKVYRKIKKDFNFDKSESNYLLLNYESFQLPSSRKLVDDLIALHQVDMIILDEIHFAKKRDNAESKRRQLLTYFIDKTSETNPNLSVLGMSATPVINSLDESVSLLELITGQDFSDLETRPKISNAHKIHEQLVLHGIRYIPKYDMSLSEKVIPVENNSLISDLTQDKMTILSIEQALLQTKLDHIKTYLKPGTIIFSQYVDGIFDQVVDFVKQNGFTVGVFNGDDKTGLKNFKDHKVDILIGSSALGTGIDGLQYVSNRMIILTLPWTSANYDQLKGRIYRQNSIFQNVEIFIPQIYLEYEGNRWSWDEQRFSRIKYKKTLSDAAVDGVFPEGSLMDPNVMLKDAKEALNEWIERLNKDGIVEYTRPKLSVPLPPEEIQTGIAKFGDFSKMNARMNSSNSSTNFDRFKKDPKEWHLYHTLYKEARESWSEIPYEVMAESLLKRPDLIIGDFGCGEAILSKRLRNKVFSFDFIAIDESVIACDMSNIDLEDEILDVSVFSLSLMGKNWEETIKEAHRLTRPGGILKIAEPAQKWTEQKLTNLVAEIEGAGFIMQGDVHRSDKFIYINATKPL